MTTRTAVLAALLLLPIAALGVALQRAGKGHAHQVDRFVVVVGYATPLLIRGPRRAPVTAKLRSPERAGKHSCSSLPHSS